MKVDLKKMDILLARRCMSLADLQPGVSTQTLARIRKGVNITPKTLGRLAAALGVDVREIMKEEA